VLDLIAHDKAGERILEELLVDAGRRLGEEGIAGDIYLFQEQRRPRILSVNVKISGGQSSAKRFGQFNYVLAADAQDEYERRRAQCLGPRPGIVCQAEGQGLLVTA
jgi:hypothetical protein